MPTVNRATSATTVAPRVTDLLKLKVTENDPALKATATAFGVKIAGKATNNGIVASFLQLKFDGKKVDLQLSKGDTATQVLKKLKAELPKGYEARVLQSDKTQPPTMTIGVAKSHAVASKFPGVVKGAGWSPGSGIALPGHGGARMGLWANVQVNPLTTVNATSKLDKASNTIVVTVNGKTGRPNQMRDTEKQIDVPSPTGMQMGHKYKLVVQDSAGHKLFGTTVTPFPAA